MTKKLRITLETPDGCNTMMVSGIYDKKAQKIKYLEEDKTKVIIDIMNKELIRENNNIYLKYLFNLEKNTDNIVKIKELNKNIQLLIKTNKFNNNDKLLEIEYEIIDSNDKFSYKIEY